MGNALYRVIVVDDDRLIREDMIASVDWEYHGFQVVAQASNGREALQYILEMCVDVVITDICMPLMDGVQLIDCVRKKLPDILFLILSNYDDFKYVRTALTLGAFDYLLKYEITPRSLSTMLRKMHDVLARSGAGRRNCGESVCAADLMADRTLQAIGRLHAGKALDASEFPDCWEAGRGMSLLFRIPGVQPGERRQWGEELTWALVGLRGVDGVCARPYVDDGLLLYAALSADTNAGEITGAFARRVKGLLPLTDSGEVLAATGAVFADYPGYADSLIELVNRCNHWDRADAALSLPDNPAARYANTFDVEQYKLHVDKIVYCLGLGRRDRIDRALDRLFDMIREERLSYATTVHVYHLLIIALNVYSATGRSDGQFLPINLLDGSVCLLDARMRTAAAIGELLGRIPAAREAVQRPEIAKAVQYMHANLNRNLDLAEVAEAVSLSRNYFCKLFRQVMGRNFVDYLHSLRMEKARVLIGATELSLGDIAELTGFNSYNYFHDIFKKHYQMTPNEYRERCKEDSA